VKVYIKSSPQHGQGVFAALPIKKGEEVLAFTGPLLTRAELNERDYHLQIDEGLYLGPSGEADDYANHSCAPNTGFNDGLSLVALRDIAPHEEITWDYSTAIDEEDFPGFPCRCGALECRNTVRSFRHLDIRDQQQLAAHLLPYLKAKVRGL
jgi:SET domain-containing protein